MFIIIVVYVLSACSERNSGKDISEEGPVRFFPVTSFIEAQIKSFDTLQVNPMHLLTVDGHTDTFWLPQPGEARGLLKAFTEHTITDTNLCRYFNESKFNDLTLDAVTFTYDPKRTETIGTYTPIRHWDVYVNNATGKIKRIYLVKRVADKQGEVEQQLTWVADKWAKITTLTKDEKGRYRLRREEKVVWNFNE